MASTNFGHEIDAILVQAGLNGGNDDANRLRNLVKGQLESVTLKDASGVNGVENSDLSIDQAGAIAAILKGMAKNDGTGWSASEFSRDQLLKDVLGIEAADNPLYKAPDNIPRNSLATYAIMARYAKSINKMRDDNIDKFQTLGFSYTAGTAGPPVTAPKGAFKDQVDAAYHEVMNSASGNPTKQLEQTIKFNKFLGQYVTQLGKQEAAVNGASNKGEIESGVTDSVAALKAALIARKAHEDSIKSGSTKTAGEQAKANTDAKDAEEAFLKKYNRTLELAGDKTELKDAIAQMIQIRAAGTLRTEWDALTTADDKKVAEYKPVYDLMESKKNVIAFNLGAETNDRGETVITGGKGAAKGGDHGNLGTNAALITAGLLGAASIGYGAMSKSKGVDENGQETSQPAPLWKKVLFCGMGAAVVVTAALAATRGKEADTLLHKVQKGVSPLLGRGA